MSPLSAPQLNRPARMAFLLAALASCALRAEAAPAAAPAAPAAASGPTGPAKSPLEQLIQDRKFQDVILSVEELRAKSGTKKFADADSEFWAATAQSRLKLADAARERFQLIAKTYPDHPRAGESLVEAAVCLLRKLEELGPGNKDKSLAMQAAKECESMALKYPADPIIGARSWYVAGNAWRLSGQDKQAVAAYEKARVMPPTDQEYPQKSTYMLGILASRDFRPSDARSFFTECATKWPQASTFDKCQKGLIRLDIVGSPAPKFSIETWLNSDPVEMEAQRGKVALVWFWETWCPHCKDTMPAMAGYKEKYKDKPFQIVGLTNNSQGQTTEIAKVFVEDPHWQITWPAAVDLSGKTANDYATAGSAPAAILVDKKGIVRWGDHPTYLSESMIEKLLAE